MDIPIDILFRDTKCLRHAADGKWSVTLQELCVGDDAHFADIESDVREKVPWSSQMCLLNIR